MTDRELLELAAKAEGHEYPWYEAHFGQMMEWNPLVNDLFALRLAVKLKLDLRFPRHCDMYVDAGPSDAYTVYLIDAGGDRAAATRRAIVRAAAALAG